MLTSGQKATLKADILANNDLNSQPNNSDGGHAIADLYNLDASPDFWVWRSRVMESEIVSATTADATTWSWPAFIARSAAEQAGWARMFATGFINPALANVRQGLADIFSGAGLAPAQRTHLLTIGRRKATRAEKLFATGTGSTASPAVMAVEGRISDQDVQEARNS